MVHKHVNDVLEQVRLFGGKEAAVQLLDDLPKLRNSVIVFLGIVPAGRSCSQPLGKEVLPPPPKKGPEVLGPRDSLFCPPCSCYQSSSPGGPLPSLLGFLSPIGWQRREAWRGQKGSVRARSPN